MPLTHDLKPTPNRDAMSVHERLGVCFHHRAENFADATALIVNPASKLSYHCLIDVGGKRRTFVPDEHVAWHTENATFHGRKDCNEFLLGCAFAGNTGRTPLTTVQIESAIEWLEERWARYGWTCDWMTDHRQIAPEYKNDLSPMEWKRLLEAIKEKFAPLSA